MTTSAALGSPVLYPAEDHMGEGEVQRFISMLLLEQLQTFLRERGLVAHASADTFFYWIEGDPHTRIAPDVYVIKGISQNEEVDSWFTWERECVPCFALEVVGKNPEKDYDETPSLYRALGVQELVLFDPHATARSRTRKRWTHFRKNKRGVLSAVEQHDRDSVFLSSLDVHLRRVLIEEERVRLRLALDEQGSKLVPTLAERASSAEERAAAAEAALQALLAATPKR